MKAREDSEKGREGAAPAEGGGTAANQNPSLQRNFKIFWHPFMQLHDAHIVARVQAICILFQKSLVADDGSRVWKAPFQQLENYCISMLLQWQDYCDDTEEILVRRDGVEHNWLVRMCYSEQLVAFQKALYKSLTSDTFASAMSTIRQQLQSMIDSEFEDLMAVAGDLVREYGIGGDGVATDMNACTFDYTLLMWLRVVSSPATPPPATPPPRHSCGRLVMKKIPASYRWCPYRR